MYFSIDLEQAREGIPPGFYRRLFPVSPMAGSIEFPCRISARNPGESGRDKTGWIELPDCVRVRSDETAVPDRLQ
ncbi:Uncharacterized protein ToN1_44410 [Aromatoleum petrolei]|nr:Uncharacterized protein ToN1_44410 [Aromatoleum petrolei]